MARAVFLWHLHQPEYRDPVSGQPLLPWVRLHATRAYTDMAAALERREKVRVVTNFAPSLLAQLEAYVSGRSVDRDEELGRKPVSALTPQERAHVVKESFSVDWDLWVKPVPRYAELLARRGSDLRRIDLLRAQEAFSAQDLLDLQVHFALAWMGFAARREEKLVAGLLEKGRGYTHEEKIALLDLSRAIAARVVPRWRELARRGIVEITCSPMFHPILPLLVDTESARRAMPEARLPPRFQYPDDAREQVRRGLSRVERDFGVRPAGMWPSEGSVSPEVIELLGGCGLRWCATDQGNLERSELRTRPQGPLHFTPWRCGELTVFFRDRDLSDAIGFRYARSEARDAAADLLRRVEAAGPEATVTVALDGENPWEHYPHSGERFLDALYDGLEQGRGVVPVLPREEIAARPAQHAISRIHSGSWIESNFRIWIGHPEDNEAWALLGAARAALAQAEKTAAPGDLERAREAMLAAEGSDWFWWYGDDFSTDNAPEFDALFRKNVAEVWRALKLPVPERLGKPIIAPYKDRTQEGAVQVPPRRLIAPAVDGFSRGYYEWSGAGIYRPGQSVGGAMYQGSGVFAQLLFGFSLRELFLRLDPLRGEIPGGELRILLTRDPPPAGALPWPQGASGREEKLLSARLAPGVECPVLDERRVQCGTLRSGALVELSLSQNQLGLAPGDRLGLMVRLLRDEVEVDRLPRYGELALVVPDQQFERENWHV